METRANDNLQPSPTVSVFISVFVFDDSNQRPAGPLSTLFRYRVDTRSHRFDQFRFRTVADTRSALNDRCEIHAWVEPRSNPPLLYYPTGFSFLL